MKTFFKILKFAGFIFPFLAALTGFSQETIPSSGGNATGSGGSSAYTLGQVVFTAISGTTGSVSQGGTAGV